MSKFQEFLRKIVIRCWLRSNGFSNLASGYNFKDIVEHLIKADLVELEPFLDEIRQLRDLRFTKRSYFQSAAIKSISRMGAGWIREKLSYASFYALGDRNFPEILELYDEDVISRLLQRIEPIYQTNFLTFLYSGKKGNLKDISRIGQLLDADIPGDQISGVYGNPEPRLELEESQKGKLKIQKTFQFYGEVQGVSFRGNCGSFADRYGIRGFARNERNGSVTTLTQGYELAIEMFFEAISNRYAGDITRVDVGEEERIIQPYEFFYELWAD